jgi:hypothetical protein
VNEKEQARWAEIIRRDQDAVAQAAALVAGNDVPEEAYRPLATVVDAAMAVAGLYPRPGVRGMAPASHEGFATVTDANKLQRLKMEMPKAIAALVAYAVKLEAEVRGMREARRWIPVAEQSPPDGIRVECYAEGWASVPQGVYDHAANRWDVWFGSEITSMRPDRWRHLPDKPTANKKEVTP